MTRDRYEDITHCLHIANAPPTTTNRDSPNYDKLHKLQWMLDELRNSFKGMWLPNQELIIVMKLWLCLRIYIALLGNTIPLGQFYF